MPETPDWAAAPQAVVTPAFGTYLAVSTFASTLFQAGIAGRNLIVAGLDVWPGDTPTATTLLRDMVVVELFDSLTGLLVTGAAISPQSPYATDRPPFGSLRLSTAADLNVLARTSVGGGSQSVRVLVFYYYE